MDRAPAIFAIVMKYSSFEIRVLIRDFPEVVMFLESTERKKEMQQEFSVIAPIKLRMACTVLQGGAESKEER